MESLDVPPGHHRLHTRWAFWYQKKHKRGTTSNWYEGLTLAGRFHTVEGFWALYSHMIRPDSLEGSVDVMLFRDGIQPMWEDDANRRGGKLSLKLRKGGMGSPLWEEVLLALIGEGFDGVPPAELCGAVLSVRFHDETLSVWNRSGDNEAAIAKIRDTLLRILCVPHYLPQLYPEYHRHGGRSAAKAGGSGAAAGAGGGAQPYPSAGLLRGDDADGSALPSPDAVSSWRGGGGGGAGGPPPPAASAAGHGHEQQHYQQQHHQHASSAAVPPPPPQHAGAAAAGAPPSIGKPAPWAKPGAAPAGSPTHAGGHSGGSPPASPVASAGRSAATAGATVSSSPSATAPKKVGGWAAAAAASPPAAAPAAATHAVAASSSSSAAAGSGAAHGPSGSAKPSSGGGQSGSGGSGDHRKGGGKAGGHTVDRPVPVQAPPASASPAGGEDDGWHTVSIGGTKPSGKR